MGPGPGSGCGTALSGQCVLQAPFSTACPTPWKDRGQGRVWLCRRLRVKPGSSQGAAGDRALLAPERRAAGWLRRGGVGAVTFRRVHGFDGLGAAARLEEGMAAGGDLRSLLGRMLHSELNI